MGTQTKEVGGGPAVGLANDFVNFLQQGLKTGTFGGAGAAGSYMGANPINSTQGIAGVLNDILSGGAGQIGGSMNQMIQQQANRDADVLRARFGQSGGTAFGTGAQFAESMLRSETAPKMVGAIGNLQMQALEPLMRMMYGMSEKGISQRETVQTPSPLAQAMSIASPILGSVLGGPLGGALGGWIKGLGGLPGAPAAMSQNLGMPGINIPGYGQTDWFGKATGGWGGGYQPVAGAFGG